MKTKSRAIIVLLFVAVLQIAVHSACLLECDSIDRSAGQCTDFYVP